MRGTPESRYFAGVTAVYYASREHDKARRQAGQQKGYMFSEVLSIAQQLSNLAAVLENEIPPKIYYISRRGIESTGVDNLRGAISLYNFGDKLDSYKGEHTVTNSELYVALRVTEEYIIEGTATPQAIQSLRREIKEATKDQEPKYKFEPDLLSQGITFLREKVENILTPDEFEKANRAFE